MKGIDLFDAGFTDLVSVIPVDAELSHNSNISPKSRGKVPGRKNQMGRWAGYPWQQHTPSRQEVMTWDVDGANIGLKAARYPGIDVDITDPELAPHIVDLAHKILGPGPVRVGRAPKALVMYRAESEVRTTRLRFADTTSGEIHLVEALGEGAQYILSGTHPITKKPYSIEDMPSDADSLTAITQDEIDAFFQELSELLPLFGYEVIAISGSNAKDRGSVDQDDLIERDLDKLASIVRSLPNDYPDREAYIQCGYAIKAATQEDPGLGLDLFLDWCDRWEQGDNSPDLVTSDWERMHPPYEIGKAWLYAQAQRRGVYDPAWDFSAEPAPEQPPEKDETVQLAMFSESALAQRFARKHAARLKSVPGHGLWFVWDGMRWSRDQNGEAFDLCRRFLDQEASRALRTVEPVSRAESLAMYLSKARTVDQVLKISANLRTLNSTLEQFDQVAHHLNTPIGVYDLRDSQRLEHRPELWQSRITPVAPAWEVETPVWDNFLTEITQGDTELRSYLQHLAGYCLWGTSREQMFAFLFGPGGNGKGVFVRQILRALGQEYSTTIPASSVTRSRHEKQTNDLAGLVGMRFVCTDETDDDDGWDEQRIKLMTGGDTIKARLLYGNFFSFDPQFTLVISSNHAPSVKNVTNAIKRRIHIVPFDFMPTTRDPLLDDKLAEEMPGILAWMIDGAAMWAENGLVIPKVVAAATEDYMVDNDDIGRWIYSNVSWDGGEDNLVEAQSVYSDYCRWCADESMRPMSLRKFGASFKLRAKEYGVQPVRDSNTRRVCYPRVRLASEFTSNVVSITR